MRLGIFAKTFPGTDPVDVLNAAAAAGYCEVQYNMACSGLAAMPDDISAVQASAIASAASEARVGIAAVSATFNMIHPDKAVVQNGLQRLQVISARCKDMGTQLVTLCSGTRDPVDQWQHHTDNATPEAWAELVSTMAAALTIAERHDVLLGIEPELANVVSSAQTADRLIRELQSARVKIVLDAANLFEVADLPAQHRIVSHAIDLLGEHIVIAHAKDRAADGSFVAAGTGVLDYAHYLKQLAAAGFGGALITHGLEASQSAPVAHFLRRQLDELAGRS